MVCLYVSNVFNPVSVIITVKVKRCANGDGDNNRPILSIIPMTIKLTTD